MDPSPIPIHCRSLLFDWIGFRFQDSTKWKKDLLTPLLVELLCSWACPGTVRVNTQFLIHSGSPILEKARQEEDEWEDFRLALFCLTVSLLSLWSRPFTRSPLQLGLTASLLSLYLLSRGFTRSPLHLGLTASLLVPFFNSFKSWCWLPPLCLSRPS